MSSLFERSREHWIEASEFLDLGSDGEVLSCVLSRVRTEVRRPLVLLDLDSTLYEVQPRTHRIIHDWLASKASRTFTETRDALARVSEQHVGYSLKDTFQALQIDLGHSPHEDAWRELKRFWAPRFFHDDYLPHDRPYPGAAEFCRNLYAEGARILYLTGRDEPGMGRGTRRNLERDGFPLEAEYYLKSARAVEDLEHKVRVAREVATRGGLTASFENEPKNVVAIQGLIPDAMHVFVHTFCSDHPARPGRGLYRIRGFGR
jgi:hypothetical protein